MAPDTRDDPATDAGFAVEMLAMATSTAVFLKSLSHPARLVLLCQMAEGPATVSEMAALVKLPQAEVSKQLARLRADGLVLTRREGRNIIYSISAARVC